MLIPMNEDSLHSVAEISQQLTSRVFDNGELSGVLRIDQVMKDRLIRLNAAGITDDAVIVGQKTISLAQLQMLDKITVTLYTKRLGGALFYDTLAQFVQSNPGALPLLPFYIAENQYFSDQATIVPAMTQFAEIVRLVTLLSELADYIQTGLGKEKKLIFFEKKKLTIPLIFNSGQLRYIPFLDKLEAQFKEAHDKEERKTIFKTELVNALKDIAPGEVFGQLLTSLDQLYEHYQQSHLLYIEKFSYQELKAGVDKDQLEYTKKIYNTVNDIQTKLIAVPAAFLLIFAQFDFTGVQFFKNILILLSAVLFAILIDILLRNQFGILRYIRTEIEHLKTNLSNKETKVDLSAFITSFANLEPLITKQRNYLWFFRAITWLVPAVTLIMLLVFTQQTTTVK